MKIVMKFGGVSVADGDKLRKVGAIVKRFRKEGHQLAVVTSAMYGVTDSLSDMALHAGRGSKERVQSFIESTLKAHRKAAEAAIMDEAILASTVKELETRCEELRNILMGVAHIGELTPRSKDFVLGYGEKLSAPLLRGLHGRRGRDSDRQQVRRCDSADERHNATGAPDP
jgi:aspartate kinase